MNLKRTKRIFFLFLSFLILIFFLLTRILEENKILGELGFNESFQHILLIIICASIIFNRFSLIKAYGKFNVYFKLFLISILLYEEVSFLTSGIFREAKLLNLQNEVNFHNLEIMFKPLFINVPLLNELPFFDDISIIMLGYFFFSIIFSYGSYFKYLKNINFLFLEKDFSSLGILFIINHYFSNPFISIGIINKQFIYHEFIETFIYLLLALDLFIKIKFKTISKYSKY